MAGLLDAGFLLTNDGPSHLLQCRVFASVDAPGSPYAGLFTASVPTTARGSCELLLLLQAALPWRAAHQIVLGLPSVLFALAAWLAARAVSPRRAWAAVIVAGLPAHTILYYGLFPYALGAGVATLGVAATVAAAATGKLASWRSAASFGAALLVVSLCHAVAAALLATLVAAALVAARENRRALLVSALRHAVLALPALAVLAGSLGYTDDNPGSAAPVWLELALRARVFFAWSQAGGTARELVGALVPSAGVALAVARLPRLAPAERAVLAVAATALALFWVLPQDALGFQILSPRALVFFVVFGAVLLPLERVPGASVVLPVLLSLACAAQLQWLWRFHGERARAADATLAFLDQPVPAPGVRLPVPLDPYLGRNNGEAWGIFGWVPGLHVAQLHALTQGGAVEYSQDRRAATQWALRTPASMRCAPPPLPEYFPRLDDTERAQRALAAARAGACWDGAIVLGDAVERSVFHRVGYQTDLENDAVLLGRFAGCALDVVLSGLAPNDALSVEVRAQGDEQPWCSATVGPGVEGGATLRFARGPPGTDHGPPAPCGPIELRLAPPYSCGTEPLRAFLPRDQAVSCAVSRPARSPSP